jgi:hypothetical protein
MKSNMARKRFTDTEKWFDVWYHRLSTKMKKVLYTKNRI